MNIEKLKSIGGNEWIKDDYHRIYFNDLEEWMGLELSRYNTGNISSAYDNGERISNTKAGKVMTRIENTKIWWDIPGGKFCYRGDEDIAVQVVEAIESKLKEE